MFIFYSQKKNSGVCLCVCGGGGYIISVLHEQVLLDWVQMLLLV